MVELREKPERPSLPLPLPLPLATGRAVAYVRMSTERQEYSTRNQLDVSKRSIPRTLQASAACYCGASFFA